MHRGHVKATVRKTVDALLQDPVQEILQRGGIVIQNIAILPQLLARREMNGERRAETADQQWQPSIARNTSNTLHERSSGFVRPSQRSAIAASDLFERGMSAGE